MDRLVLAARIANDGVPWLVSLFIQIDRGDAPSLVALLTNIHFQSRSIMTEMAFFHSFSGSPLLGQWKGSSYRFHSLFPR